MFILKINTENDAFSYDPRGEIARILEDVAEKIRNGKEPSTILDANGNSCGNITWNI